MSDFSRKIEEFRTRTGLSQSALAHSAGIDVSLMSRLATGDRRPARRELVLDLSRALALGFDEQNELLLAAGYAPIFFDDIVQADATMKLLADVLEDDQVPEDEKLQIRRQVELVHRRWRPATQTTGTKPSTDGKDSTNE